MKKLVFATQVFALIAMFPVIVILEMNHTKANASGIDSAPGFQQETEIKSKLIPEQEINLIGTPVFPGIPGAFIIVKTF